MKPSRTWREAGARLFGALAAMIALLVALPARAAFTPPPLQGHVVDTAGKLTSEERRALDARLDQLHKETGYPVVAFLAGPLDGEDVDDVAYKAFNTWKIGDEGKDNGVLLLIAPSERKVRIETGKGVGGALTDLQSNDIIREVISPYLRQNRFREAIDHGSAAIVRTLVEGSAGDPAAPGRAEAPVPAPSLWKVAGIALALVAFVVLMGVSPAFRSMFFVLAQFLLIFGGRGGGGGAGGGSGYRGGGGRSGGGGSTDSY